MTKIILKSFFLFTFVLSFLLTNLSSVVMANTTGEIKGPNETRRAINGGWPYYAQDGICLTKASENTTDDEKKFIEEFGDTSGIAWMKVDPKVSLRSSVAFGELQSIPAYTTIAPLVVAAYLKRKDVAGQQDSNITLALRDLNNEALVNVLNAGGSREEMINTMTEILKSYGDSETNVVIKDGGVVGQDTIWSFGNQVLFLSALSEGKIVSKANSDYIISKMNSPIKWGMGVLNSSSFTSGWGLVGQTTRQMGISILGDGSYYVVAFGNSKSATAPDEAANTKLAEWFRDNVYFKVSNGEDRVETTIPSTSIQGDYATSDSTKLPQERIYSILLAKGLTPIQAVGFVVNIESESGLGPNSKPEDAAKAAMNTSEVGGQYGNRDPFAPGGLGLIQWTGPRREAIVKYSILINKDVFDFDFQVNYLWKEMVEGVPEITLRNGSKVTAYKKVYEDLKKATTIEEAQRVVLEDFLSPKQIHVDERNKSQPPRAKELLEQLAGVSASNGDPNNNCGEPSSAGKYGWDLKEGPNKMVYYAQGDPKWSNNYYVGTIGSSGCGITSLAMVISTLGSKKVEPPETARWSLSNGFADGGTSWGAMPAAAKEYNLNFEEIGSINFSKAKSILMDGGLIIISFQGGFFGNHYMVVRKVSEDGKTFYFADPEQSWGDGFKQTNTKGFTVEDIMSKGPPANMWAFKKKG